MFLYSIHVYLYAYMSLSCELYILNIIRGYMYTAIVSEKGIYISKPFTGECIENLCVCLHIFYGEPYHWDPEHSTQ